MAWRIARALADCGRLQPALLPLQSLARVLSASPFARSQSQVARQEERAGSEAASRPEDIPLERIRNFSIIAHIDHGKSTLADRIIESAGTRAVKQAQLLDSLQVERERGITVKRCITLELQRLATPAAVAQANSASIVHRHKGQDYLLNLVDTPGHVDFSYEVSRSLAACQGALLLVDGAQGIQAQTVANFYLAFELDLAVVPVINKVDLPAADAARVAGEVEAAFDLPAAGAVRCSAKSGLGVADVLAAVVERMPAPTGRADAPFRLLLFDAHADEYRGVVCLVFVRDGVVRKGDRLRSCSTGSMYDVLELGIMTPEMQQTQQLRTGQVGYVVTGLKSTKAARVGDTWQHHKAPPDPLPGFRPAKALMFAGIFPLSQEGFERLDGAIEALTLNDASVSVQRETSAALGPGFRCGFLGMLHMDVFMQRLEQEHGEEVLTTTPMVPFRLAFEGKPDVDLSSPHDFPKEKTYIEVLEPTVNCTIITPERYTGQVLQLCASKRGDLLEHSYLTSDRCMIRYQLPLAELAGQFYGSLKACTSGYATFDYEEGPYRSADLVRLDFLVHGIPVDALTRVLHRSDAVAAGRAVCQKLVSVVSKQAFEVAVQAYIGSKVVARETVRATRKDVLAKCYGGDVTRKRKLLEKQKEGKSKLRRLGAVTIEPEDFHAVMAAR